MRYECFYARFSTRDEETKLSAIFLLFLDMSKSTDFLRDEFCKKGGIYLLKFIIWYQENINLDQIVSFGINIDT